MTIKAIRVNSWPESQVCFGRRGSSAFCVCWSTWPGRRQTSVLCILSCVCGSVSNLLNLTPTVPSPPRCRDHTRQKELKPTLKNIFYGSLSWGGHLDEKNISRKSLIPDKCRRLKCQLIIIFFDNWKFEISNLQEFAALRRLKHTKL